MRPYDEVNGITNLTRIGPDSTPSLSPLLWVGTLCDWPGSANTVATMGNTRLVQSEKVALVAVPLEVRGHGDVGSRRTVSTSGPSLSSAGTSMLVATATRVGVLARLDIRDRLRRP